MNTLICIFDGLRLSVFRGKVERMRPMGEAKYTKGVYIPLESAIFP